MNFSQFKKILKKILTKLATFCLIYYGINLIFTVINVIIKDNLLDYPSDIIPIVLAPLIALYITIYEKNLKYPRIYLFFVITTFDLTFIMFEVFYGWLEYIAASFHIVFLFITAFLINKNFIKKYIWLLILIFVIRIYLSIGDLHNSNTCNIYDLKSGQLYGCDCQGLERSSFLERECIGKRTTCYKYLDIGNKNRAEIIS